MRTRTAAAITAGLLLSTLTACGSSDQEANKAVATPKTVVATPKPPLYAITHKIERTDLGSVDLVIPNATEADAKAAIHHYAKSIDDRSFSDYGINVIRDKDDKGVDDYVCHGEWVKDGPAARVYTGGRVTSDTWPAVGMFCSNPEG